MKKYWLINVLGKHGFSTMVHGEIDTEEQAINAALDNDLFQDVEDADYAFAEEADGYTIEHFNNLDAINEL